MYYVYILCDRENRILHQWNVAMVIHGSVTDGGFGFLMLNGYLMVFIMNVI